MTRSQVIEKARQRFGPKIREVSEPAQGRVYLTIDKHDLVALAEFLFKEMGARFLITVGTDRREQNGTFEVLHIFALDEDKSFMSLRMAVDPGDPTLPSITPVVPGANWAERELYDMVGVKPLGHPDPRRLVMADDWPLGVFPLRRDVPHDLHPEPDPSAAPPRKDPPEGATVIPVGPFFPVLEEPAYFRLFVEGETVIGSDYRGFYNHRGIEKLGDSALTYNQVSFLAERICGICGNIHSVCYCEAVEQAIGIRASRRARYIRSLMLELERIHSHLLWLGIAGHIIGFETVLMQSWRIREPVMWLCEYLAGNRKTYGLNLIGGVRRDITAEQCPKILETVHKVEAETLAVVKAIEGDIPLQMRLRDIGPIPYDHAKDICIVGPSARGSGVAIDARVDHPYAAYDELIADKKVHQEGDVLARTLVRLEETLDSIRLVREAVKGLQEMPEGDIILDIHEEVPPNREGIVTVEAPRGEAIHYVLTGGDNRPFRWRVRAPTYPNLQSVPVMIQNQALADIPISLGSLDPCFSCTERFEVVDLKSGSTRVCGIEELTRMGRGESD